MGQVGWFCEKCVGSNEVTPELCLYGLVGGGSDVRRRGWILSAIVKEVVWEGRCGYRKGSFVLSEEECTEWVLSKLYYVLLYDRKRLGVEEADGFWNFGRWRLG